MATMKHVKLKSTWKKLDISPDLLSNTGFSDLISFEELTDYEIVNAGVIPGSSKQKGKEVTKNEGEESAQTKPSKKKKNKKKPKKKDDKTKQCKGSTIKQKHGKTLIIDNNKVQDINEETEKIDKQEKKEVKKQEEQKKINKRKSKGEGETTPKQKKAKFKSVQAFDDEDAPETDSVTSDMARWKGLFVPPQVLAGLRDQGFTSPTSIQAFTLPSAIRDRMDILGAAETGSGKTLAFGIPILHHILQYNEKQEEKRKAKKAAAISEKEEVDNSADEEDNEEEEEEGEEERDTEDESDDGEGDDVSIDEDGSDSGVQEDLPLDDDDDGEDDLGSDVDLPPDEEDMEGDMEDGGVGCVRVINNIELDLPEIEESVAKDTGSSKPLIALILEPTRELAIQVKNHLMAAAKHTDIKIATVVGGMAPQKQQRVLRKSPEIVIATPGRLWELIQQGDPHLCKVTKVHKLVIDEADRMVEKGHFEELSRLLELINGNVHQKKKRQTFVFSATLTMLHSGPQRYIKKKKRKKEKMDAKKKLELLMEHIGMKEKPKIVDLTTKTGTAETLTEARINCSAQEKDLYLYYFLKQYPGRTLVFTNSKDCIRRLVSIFTLLRCCPLPLHADMHQRQRLKNLDKFSGSGEALLIASDVAARGLDIPDVQHVIHYQVPRTIENYVHRSGRTARAMKEGLSVMLVGPEDVGNYRKIIQNLNKNEDLPLFPVEYHAITARRPVITLARQIDTEEHRFKKRKVKNDWFTKTAQEMDMILDEAVLEDPSDLQEQQQHKHRQQVLRSQLDAMIRQPLVQKTYSGKYPTKMGKLMIPEQKEDTTAVQRVKKDRPAQEKMLQHIAAHPRVVKKKGERRKLKKEEKRKKKKMERMKKMSEHAE